MNFRTQVPFFFSNFEISHTDSILMMGSCFTENLGHVLQQYKFDTELNPFGILFNPVSIANAIENIMECKIVTADDLFFHDGLFHSWAHHSIFSGADEALVLKKINENIVSAHEKLKNAKVLFITLGTAFAYLHKPLYTTVANCHKVPANKFVKKLYDSNELYAIYKKMLYALSFFNPKLKIVFTVSPVRHIKDGFMENNVSKGILFQLIYALNGEFKQSSYFPSYEIVMDELRDYRFYKKDMLHPNEMAIEYIWERFSDYYFNEKTKEINSKLEEIEKDLAHRPFNEQTEAHEKFKATVAKKIAMFKANYPNINS